MTAKSLLSAFSLGKQADQATAATAFITSLSTESGAEPKLDRAPPEMEHPGVANRSTARKSLDELTGYTVTVGNSFSLRPRYIGRVLQAMGMTCTTVNNTTYYTHTFTIAADASMLWMSAISKWSGATDFSRIIKAVRGTETKITATTANPKAKSTFAGLGLVEATAAGTETFTSEVDVPFSIYSGSITFDINGTNITHSLRGIDTTITQDLDAEDRVLFSQARNSLDRKSFSAVGVLQGFDLDAGTYNLYKLITRGSTGGTAPYLTAAANGALTYNFQSLSNITGAAVPYKMTFTYDTVQYMELANTRAVADNLIRCDIPFEMVDNDTTPLSIVLINDVAAY